MMIWFAYLDLQRAIVVMASFRFELLLCKSTTGFDLLPNYLNNLVYNRIKYFLSKLFTMIT